ncbi:unnamed protein product, partial [Scytosiphon promiscuus]
DGNVDLLTRSNQEEEDAGGSAYGSGDFDELSKAGGSESEVRACIQRDARMYEDDRSSNDSSPITGDGSESYTTGTGTKGEGEGAAGAAIVGGATSTAELDERNSISTYGDDFAEDEDSVVPPAAAQAAGTRRASSSGSSSDLKNVDDSDKDHVDQQERVGPSPEHAADAVASSTPSPASEVGARVPTSGSGSYSRSTSNETASARAGKERQERRRSSASSESKKTNRNKSDGGTATAAGKAAGGVALGDSGVDSGTAPSAHKLEERLREADLENARLREALEKNVARELEILKSQVEAARAMMLSNLDEGEGKRERSLLELVLLAESKGYKQAEQVPSGEGKRRESSTAYPAATAASVKAESIARAELEKRVESLEKDLTRAGQESRAQSARAESLQRQLDSHDGSGGSGGGDRSGSGRGRRGSRGAEVHAVGVENVAEGVATADIMALKAKATQLVERLRQEKAARLKADRKTQRVAGKVQVLSDHIEKLMMFLKHEATQKAKAHEQQRRLQKELELVKAGRSTALLRSNQAKDRVMTELREGSKILEDQLRLMDEKYMELRTKLDWTRTKSEKDVRRARAQASALRTKWAILCGGGEGGESSLLDTMKVDSAPHLLGHSSSAPPGTAQQGGGGGGVGTAGYVNHHNDYAATGGHPKFGAGQPQPQPQHHGGGPSRGGGSPPITRRGVVSGQLGGARGGGLAPNMSEPSFPAG